MGTTAEQIYEEFAAQLCEWSETGKIPSSANQDIRYGLSLQKQRLDKCHARMEYRLKLRGETLDKISNTVFSDTKYTNQLVWRHYNKTADYYVGDRKCLSVKGDELLYTIITWLNRSEVQETYCCPNCGNISEISALMEGCPYCGTKFLMSDLFPKVTDFHFLRDYAMNNKEAKTRISKWLITGALIGLVLFAPSTVMNFFRDGREGVSLAGRIFYAALSLVTSGALGAVAGYAAGAVRMLVSVLKDGVRQAPMAAGLLKARKALDTFMKPFDPSFSFEYFISSMQALLKILIFTDDRSNLAVYEGPSTGNLFDTVIDAQFGGAINLNKCWIQGNYSYLDLDIYMTDVYCQDSRIYQKSDVFRMVVCKNISRPADYGFSIKKVSCKNCGASFDASREKHCPYCHSSYDLKEDSWVIMSIRKK